MESDDVPLSCELSYMFMFFKRKINKFEEVLSWINLKKKFGLTLKQRIMMN